MTVTSAVQGDRRGALEAIRANLAARLDGCEDREAASVARQLIAVLGEIEALPIAKESDPVNDLATKRAKRRAASSVGVDSSAG